MAAILDTVSETEQLTILLGSIAAISLWSAASA